MLHQMPAHILHLADIELQDKILSSKFWVKEKQETKRFPAQACLQIQHIFLLGAAVSNHRKLIYKLLSENIAPEN